MGITVIRSPCGEAEKSCAFLNLIGRCDAVITEDSDVFLYGAKCVYKNFSMDKKSQDTIEEYRMDRIEKELGYSREMLILLALLLGCDYDQKGIPGVGKELACKFLNELIEMRESNVLDLIRNWCKTNSREIGKYEEKVRRLILANGTRFPNEEIIKEFMEFSKMSQILLSEEKYLKIKWNRPNLMNLQIFNENKQTWPFEYTADKSISLIIQYEYSLPKEKATIQAIRINKVKRRAYVEYFEVIWSKMKANDSDRDLSDLSEYVTLEKMDLFEKRYPDLVKEYNNKIESKKASRSKKKRKMKKVNKMKKMK